MLVAEGAIEPAARLDSKPWDLAPLESWSRKPAAARRTCAATNDLFGQLISTNGKIHDEVLAILR